MLHRLALLGVALAFTVASPPCEGGPCMSEENCNSGYNCYERERGASVGICLTLIQAKTRNCEICDGEGVCWQVGSSRSSNSRDDNNEVATLRQLLKDYQVELDQKNYQLHHEEQLLRSRRSSSVVKYVVFGAVTFAVVVLIIFLFERFFPRRRRNPRPAPQPEIIRIDPESSDDSSVASETEHLLREENETAGESSPDLNPEDPDTCKICFDHKIDCVILDCGHMCVCMPCAKRLRLCPICRKPIRKRKRVYK
eukprot:TRINITY_DN13998_c0_g1_i1.p1 TRINITY_DN13998_c0_g1~~TRINITY_DN13998_c0_g1_i1.p1  ORF type:complete len:275 (+),score=43.39 TRINITY_DN13998_c0_g1_i1:64-825(+)